MPSGPKKRKAERRRRERQAILNRTSSSSSRGNDDPKNKDKRGSSSNVGSHTSEKQPVKEIVLDADNGKKELRPEVEIKTTDVIVVNNTSSSNNNSSRSSSDEESQAIKKKDQEVVRTTGNASIKEAIEKVGPILDSLNHVIEKVSDETILACNAAKSSLKEKEQKSISVDLQSKGNAGKVAPLPEKKAEASSVSMKTAVKQDEGKLLPSSYAPVSEMGNGLKPVKASEHSVNEPLLASVPTVAQRTSWLSCCGLFDLITGSRT